MCLLLLPIVLPQTGHVLKKDLQKKKNDDEVEEGWVQCDCCDNWVHMICGLFNKGKNDQTVHYLCPTCLMHVRHMLAFQPLAPNPALLPCHLDKPQQLLGPVALAVAAGCCSLFWGLGCLLCA